MHGKPIQLPRASEVVDHRGEPSMDTGFTKPVIIPNLFLYPWISIVLTPYQ